MTLLLGSWKMDRGRGVTDAIASCVYSYKTGIHYSLSQTILEISILYGTWGNWPAMNDIGEAVERRRSVCCT